MIRYVCTRCGLYVDVPQRVEKPLSMCCVQPMVERDSMKLYVWGNADGTRTSGMVELTTLPAGEVLVFRSPRLMDKLEIDRFWSATESLRDEYAKRSLPEPIMLLVDGGDSIEAFDEPTMNRLGWFKKKDA